MPSATSRFFLILTLLLSALLGCASGRSPGIRSQASTASPSSTLLLISLDGFRWDYLDRYPAPHLRELAQQGARAEGLVPVFPSLTFPNHYTIVTGLYPEHHGIIANEMYDPQLGQTFQIHDREAVVRSEWWGGEPL